MGALDMPVVSSSDTVERELAQLDTAKAVDDQLAALKKEIVSDGRPPR
jgi:phage shock protein A